jgi:K+-transporting ATPase ATPase A chain
VQTIPQGPIASQEAIKMLGTNGGGFTNANSAHPFENPTPLSNFLQMLSIFLIPAGLTYTFGKMVKDTRQGWAIFAAMSILFLAGVFVAYPSEQAGNPNLARLGIETHATAAQSGGNMEGKEVRFGIADSALFTVVTTDASCGAVNNMHDSLTPLAGLVPLVNIELGEVVFGGVGSGLYGMLLFAVLAVFIAGLMVGRTPEYLGKKIEQKEVKMMMLAVMVLAFTILGFAAASVNLATVAKSLGNNGPHGLSEVLYGFTSAVGNNGSAFGGLSANTPYLNTTLGLAMLFGRFLMLIPLLAAAGSLAAKKQVPLSAGTFPTHGPLFVGLLVGVVVIVGALTFFPALSLGPVVEHFLMWQGRLWS